MVVVVCLCVSLWTKYEVTTPTSQVIQPTQTSGMHKASRTFESMVSSPTVYHFRTTVVYDSASYATEFRLAFTSGYFMTTSEEVWVNVNLDTASATLNVESVPDSGVTMSSRFDSVLGHTVYDVE